MSMLEQLNKLLLDVQSGGVTNYTRYENTIVSLVETAFGADNEFTIRVRKIKSGWGLPNAVNRLYGKASMSTHDKEAFDAYIQLLEEAIDYLSKYSKNTGGSMEMDNKKVFIVHGHDERLKFEMSDWLRSIDLEPVILHLRANIGLTTIIDKIEQNADVGCAIILMTADDLGKKKSALDLQPRARQNVVFEAGYFLGKLGRKRVVMVYDDGVEPPGDLGGCIYIPAENSGSWKEAIRGEFDAIGIDYKK